MLVTTEILEKATTEFSTPAVISNTITMTGADTISFVTEALALALEPKTWFAFFLIEIIRGCLRALLLHYLLSSWRRKILPEQFFTIQLFVFLFGIITATLVAILRFWTNTQIVPGFEVAKEVWMASIMVLLLDVRVREHYIADQSRWSRERQDLLDIIRARNDESSRDRDQHTQAIQGWINEQIRWVNERANLQATIAELNEGVEALLERLAQRDERDETRPRANAVPVREGIVHPLPRWLVTRPPVRSSTRPPVRPLIPRWLTTTGHPDRDDNDTCPICYEDVTEDTETYTCPHLLCHHSFCRSCVVRTRESLNDIRCSFCRRETELPEDL